MRPTDPNCIIRPPYLVQRADDDLSPSLFIFILKMLSECAGQS